MKKLLLFLCFVLICTISFFYFGITNKVIKKGILVHGDFEVKTMAFLDEGIYWSMLVTDNNGNDVKLSCWFCESDQFIKEAIKHLQKLENPN